MAGRVREGPAGGGAPATRRASRPWRFVRQLDQATEEGQVQARIGIVVRRLVRKADEAAEEAALSGLTGAAVRPLVRQPDQGRGR